MLLFACHHPCLCYIDTSLTLGMHAQEGYCSCLVCVCVCLLSHISPLERLVPDDQDVRMHMISNFQDCMIPYIFCMECWISATEWF